MPSPVPLLSLLVLLLLGCAAVSAAEPGPTSTTPVDVPRLTAAGELDDRGLALIALAGSGTELKPFRRFGATARLGWSDEGLLARVRVVDATPYEAAGEDRLYDGDSVELFLAGPPGDREAGMVQLVVSPGRDPAHPAVRRRLFDYRGAALKKRGVPVGRTDVRRTADGYVVDLILPWANLGLAAAPERGAVFGVRVGVNDGEPGRERARLTWVMPAGKAGDFFVPPPVRLAEKAGSSPPTAICWGDYDEGAVTHIHVVADPALAGKPVRVATGGVPRATGTLRRDGGRAAVSLSFPAPAPGRREEGLSVMLDGKPLHAPALPDIDAFRRDLLREGVSDGQGGRSRARPWAVPAFRPAAFSGDRFPAFGYPDLQRLERLIGPVEVKTTFYDAAGRLVERPAAPGRYGAVVAVTAPSLGETAVGYRTLFRRPSGGGAEGDGGDDPVRAAAAFEKAPNAAKADRDWWHALRKRLGTAVRYEYHVRLPAGYDADPVRRWPVLFYLHGSGGGDPQNWDKVKESDGPQGAASRDPERFPFVVVSLRSPGGWYPPAVKDVMDEVEAKYHIDPAREYLTGFSMGGMGAWNVAYDQPSRFAAVAPVGARTGDPARMPLLKGVAVWVFNGAEDVTTTAADARAAVESLRTVGVAAEVKYTEIPGAGHVESLQTAYAGTELYDWLLRHKRGR